MAGEKLTGSLYFDSPSDAKAQGVVLEFLGQEETLVKYTYENSTSTEYNTPSARTKDAISSRNLIQVKLPMEQTNLIQNGTIPAGKYNLPFTIDLPKLLPSTFRENYHDGSYCQIIYVLKAEIKGSGIFSNYKDKQEIKIVAPPLSEDRRLHRCGSFNYDRYAQNLCTNISTGICCHVLFLGMLTVCAMDHLSLPEQVVGKVDSMKL